MQEFQHRGKDRRVVCNVGIARLIQIAAEFFLPADEDQTVGLREEIGERGQRDGRALRIADRLVLAVAGIGDAGRRLPERGQGLALIEGDRARPVDIRAVGVAAENLSFGRGEAVVGQRKRFARDLRERIHRAAALACVKGDRDQRRLIDHPDRQGKAVIRDGGIRFECDLEDIRGCAQFADRRRTAVALPAEQCSQIGIVEAEHVGVASFRVDAAADQEDVSVGRRERQAAVAVAGVAAVLFAVVVEREGQAVRVAGAQVGLHVLVFRKRRVIAAVVLFDQHRQLIEHRREGDVLVKGVGLSFVVFVPAAFPTVELCPVRQGEIFGEVRQIEPGALAVFGSRRLRAELIGGDDLFDVGRRQRRVARHGIDSAGVVGIRSVGVVIEVGLVRQRKAAFGQHDPRARQRLHRGHRAAAFAGIERNGHEIVWIDDRDVQIAAHVGVAVIRIEIDDQHVAGGIVIVHRLVITHELRTELRGRIAVIEIDPVIVGVGGIGAVDRKTISLRRHDPEIAVAAVGVWIILAAVVIDLKGIARAPLRKVGCERSGLGQLGVVAAFAVLKEDRVFLHQRRKGDVAVDRVGFILRVIRAVALPRGEVVPLGQCEHGGKGRKLDLRAVFDQGAFFGAVVGISDVRIVAVIDQHDGQIQAVVGVAGVRTEEQLQHIAGRCQLRHGERSAGVFIAAEDVRRVAVIDREPVVARAFASAAAADLQHVVCGRNDPQIAVAAV